MDSKHTKTIKILKIEKTNEEKDVYDIQIKNNHNFFANGNLVHNCLIFQEQLQLVYNKLCNIPLEETDKVRKAFTKKDISNKEKAKADRDKLCNEFISLCRENSGIEEEISRKMFENMEKLVAYSFNKSHAIAYAITTWQCAWFFTYYPDEWITTYLDYCAIEKGDSTGQEDPKAVAMKEAKSLGYKFSKPDINFSHYTTVMHPTIPKTIIPSFSAMKGLGETGVQEIIQNRPYQNLLDLLVDKNTGDWKHSKFNKRGIETLIKLEALDSLNAVGENGIVKTYKELEALVIGNYDKLKKATERKKNRDIEPLIKQFASEISGKLGDWTDKEKIQMQQELYGSVDFSLIVPEKILEELATLGYDCVDTWEEKGNYWAVISSVTEAVTKTGKPYLKLKIYGKSLKEYPCSIWNIKSGKTLLSQNDLIVGKFDKNDYGFSTSVNQIQKLNQ